jgi:hypothetical protein
MKAISSTATAACSTDAKRPTRHAAFAVSLLTAMVLAACGGGGGGASGAPTESPTSAGSGSSDGSGSETSGNNSGANQGGALASDPFVSGANAFDFDVDASLAAPGALDGVLGGSAVYGAWNPQSPSSMNQPGVKVNFFGQAAGCSASSVNGTVAQATDTDVGSALGQMGIASAAGARSWSPVGVATGCSAGTQGSEGPAMVYMSPDATSGGVGLRTLAGGSGEFFGAYGAAGQNGAGANAFIAGTFVSFRAAWNVASPIRPWAGSDHTARVFSQQSVASSDVAGTADASNPVQVKQQISIGFINTACAAAGITNTNPCQLKYLFNTAVYRAGVSDWSTQSWFKTASVMYDPGQGGIPVVDGPVTAAGVASLEDSTGASLYTSAGAASQHGAFADQPFDLRISFDQLQSLLRLIVSQKLGVSVAQVADSDVAAMWGSQWNDPNAWALLTASVGQEAHNPFTDREAMIGGSFKKLYVGPQR